MSFEETIRQIIREEINNAIGEIQNKNELPPLLTRKEMMEVLRISSTKAAELMNRPDFPVFREAGLLIPTEMLFEWVRRNTRWLEKNSKYYQIS